MNCRINVLMLLAASMLQAAQAPSVLIVGDSLSAAYGINSENGWVSLLQQHMEQQGYPYAVVNASQSGETTRGALARLPELLSRNQPEVVVIELGGNDGLRGISIDEMQRNLSLMIEMSKKHHAKVLLTRMSLPPNYGSVYIQRFEETFDLLARDHDIPLAPFILKGIAEQRELMQEDGIHPRLEAQPMMLSNLWPALEPLL